MTTLHKAFAIIEAVVSNQGHGLAFAEVVALAETPKASTHRILKDLVDIGVLTYSAETSRYRGSLKLAGLGAEVTAHSNLRDHVNPHLRDLNEETGHACHFGIRNGDAGVYLDKVEAGDYGIKLFSAVGKSFPLYCTGMGKILLAFSDGADADRILSKPLKKLTAKTLTDPKHIKEVLSQVREQGYAMDREEITRGIVCVAAPVFGAGGVVLGAISAAFPAYIEGDRGIEKEIEAVKRCASAISGTMEKDMKT
jgi:DNA-binding IclR family transcriptional regulator